MTYRRYSQITRVSSLYSADDVEASPLNERHFNHKATPLLNAFIVSSQKAKKPTQDLAIDETIIPYKV